MKSKLVTLGITALAIIALSLEASSQAVAQGNANKPAPARKAKPAATKKNANTPPPPAPAPAATAAAPATKPARKKVVHRTKPNAMAGVPSGVANCVKHLSEMAAKDPLIAYEGHPSEIVNNGLLWNDPKSKCSVGSDENMRQKVFDLATAWRMNDAAKVRSILQELEGMSPK